MSKITQEARVLQYMQDFGSITSYEAFTELGVVRLASRIHDLTRKGYRIASKFIERQNRYGESCRFKKYWIMEGETIDGNTVRN